MKFDDKLKNLVLLMEECAELQKAASKMYRWGPESKHPNGGPNNRELLVQEMGDVVLSMSLIKADYDIEDLELEVAATDKLKRLEEYYE